MECPRSANTGKKSNLADPYSMLPTLSHRVLRVQVAPQARFPVAKDAQGDKPIAGEPRQRTWITLTIDKTRLPRKSGSQCRQICHAEGTEASSSCKSDLADPLQDRLRMTTPFSGRTASTLRNRKRCSDNIQSGRLFSLPYIG